MAGVYFGRCYKLTIGERTFETPDESGLALDIRFDVSYSRGIAKNGRFGHVSILGLSHDSMRPFLETAALDRAKSLDMMLGVKLEAGYIDVGMEDIIDGVVVDANITSPPEMWLNLTVQEAIDSGGPKKEFGVPYTSEGVKLPVLASRCFDNVFGYSFTDLSDNKEIVHSFSSRKMSLAEAKAEIQKLSNHWEIVQRGVNIYAYKAPIDPDDEDCYPPGLVTADYDHGLLAVGGINCTDATVTTYLQPENPYLSKLKLTSDINQQANGTYIIVKKQHFGHFRGKEWYTRYTCTGKKTK